MGTTVLLVAISASSFGQAVKQDEIDQQNRNFQRWWGADLEWRYDELPKKGAVKRFRRPYSGFIYPDASGGTTSVLEKYDQAFHDGQRLAAGFEQRDATSRQEQAVERRGLFGLRTVQVNRTPHWHGHCNGWAASAIRHAEPQRAVRRHGVLFAPADIKGLLAELYVFSENVFLGGVDYTVNPGTFHVVLCNWLGRGFHPVGMEATPGEEKWNYPIYAYNTTHRRKSDHVLVKMNIAYSGDTEGEFDTGPVIKRIKYFHYRLDLNEDGEIVGGKYFPDSEQVDMLWVPRQPKQGGTAGNEEGNPHLDVDEVLAIWRASVPESLRRKWLNIDPTDLDKVVDSAEADSESDSDETEHGD